MEIWMSLEKIDEIFDEMEKSLKNNKDLNEFSPLLASFNRELNQILRDYATLNDEEKKNVKPYTTFYRYFFEIAIYVTQSDEFFQNPDNFLQLLYLIQNRNLLIKTKYTEYAQEETETIERIKPVLEAYLKKRLEELEDERL